MLARMQHSLCMLSSGLASEYGLLWPHMNTALSVVSDLSMRHSGCTRASKRRLAVSLSSACAMPFPAFWPEALCVCPACALIAPHKPRSVNPACGNPALHAPTLAGMLGLQQRHQQWHLPHLRHPRHHPLLCDHPLPPRLVPHPAHPRHHPPPAPRQPPQRPLGRLLCRCPPPLLPSALDVSQVGTFWCGVRGNERMIGLECVGDVGCECRCDCVCSAGTCGDA